MGTKRISAYPLADPMGASDTVLGVQGGATVQFRRDALPLDAQVFNVRAYGAAGDGSTDDTAKINAAYAAAIATMSAFGGSVAIYFPPGVYRYVNSTLNINTGRVRFHGLGSIVKFYGTAQWQIGDASHAAIAYTEFNGLKLQTDSSSSVDAPIYAYDAGRVYFNNTEWVFVKNSCVSLRAGILHFRDCESYINAGGGSLVAATIPTGASASIHIQGGVYSGQKAGGQYLINHTGAGRLDGVEMHGIFSSDYSGCIYSAPTSGGEIDNVCVYGSLIDQVDQKAFAFVPGSGATLGSVDIVGNTINGYSSSTATSGAFVSVDLTSGATHDDVNFRVANNALRDARVRAVEILGGTFNSVVISGNVASDWGRQANVASRFAYIAGTFAYLEFARNHARTQRTHDYDVEFGTVTSTRTRIEGNSFGGLAANTSQFNSYAYHTGEIDQLDFTVSGTTATVTRSKLKGVALTRTAAGTYTLTYPSATPQAGMAVIATGDGCYASVNRTSSTVVQVKFYTAGTNTLADPTAASVVLAKAA